MVLKQRTMIPAQSSVPVRVTVQEWPGSTVTKGGCAVASVEFTRYPVGGNDGLVFVEDEGNAYMMVDNMLDAEVTLQRGAYIGAVERVQDMEELVLEEKDAPMETPPQGECTDKDKVKMLGDIVSEQVKQLPPELQKEYIDLIVSNHDVFSKSKEDLGLTMLAEHSIALKDDKLIYVKQFQLAEQTGHSCLHT